MPPQRLLPDHTGCISCQAAGGCLEVWDSESGNPTLLQGAFFCDLVLIYLIKKSNFYRNKKYEEAR